MTPEQIRDAWNAQADEYNRWDTLSWQEIVEWTFQCVQDKQRQWVGLTNDELEEVFPAIATYHPANKTLYRSIARAVEAELKAKNEAT
jgi:hypothetical protein